MRLAESDSGGSRAGATRRGTAQGQDARPRSERAILDAAYSILLEDGLDAVTVEAIAKRARVSKVTIYRWWPNRAAVIMSAFLDKARDALPYPEVFTAEDLKLRLRQMADQFAGPIGTMICAIVAAGQSDPEIARAFREGYILARREQGVMIFSRAMERGVIRTGDPDAALDLMYGPLYFRLLVGHKPLDELFLDSHVANVVGGLVVAPK